MPSFRKAARPQQLREASGPLEHRYSFVSISSSMKPLSLTESHLQASNAWRVLGLLFLANLMNMYDRVIPAVIAEPLRAEFDLSDVHLGLVGTAFTIVYAIAGIPLGRLADRGSRRAVIGWGLALWSAFTAFTGMASGFFGFLLMRIGVGIGEASFAPAANSLLSDLFPRGRRSRAVGIFMLGLPLGLVAGFFTVGAITQAFESWRAPFFLAALPGLLLAVAFIFVREPQRGASDPGARAALLTPVPHPIRAVLRVRTMWWIILSGIGHNFATYAANTFMVPLLQRHFQLELKSAALVTGALIGLTGLVAMTLGGVLADRMQERRDNGRLFLCTGGMLLAAACTYAALRSEGVVAFAWLFGIGWLAAYLYAVCVYPVVQELVVPQLRATAMAVYFAAMYLLGGAFGSLAVGALSDHLAERARLQAFAPMLDDLHRATGLHDAMMLIPAALLLTAFATWMASRSVRKEPLPA